MIITNEELKSILNELAQTGNTYLCEAQFQFELAWELRKHFESQNRSDCHIYLEYPSQEKDEDGKRKYYDIVIKENNLYCVIELKYKTRYEEDVKLYGKKFTLTNQAAQDLGRYDFLNDVSRIEIITSLNNLKLECGYAIFLTNDSIYWEKDGKGRIYEEFSLKDGREIPADKQLKWREGTKSTSVGEKRIDGLNKLNGQYTVSWKPYNDKFKYLIFEIK